MSQYVLWFMIFYKNNTLTVTCILLCINNVVARQYDRCPSSNVTKFSSHFGIKTAHRFSTDRIFERQSIPDCKVEQLWMLSRHGFDNPHHEAVDRLRTLDSTRQKILESHAQGKSSLCVEAIENLKNWKLYRDILLKADDLAMAGWKEGKDLGKRLKKAYPELFKKSRILPTNRNYVFQSAPDIRHMLSLNALMEGLFNNGHIINVQSSPEQSLLFQPHENCPRWYHANRKARVEYNEMISSSDYADFLENVSQRLGFNISSETVRNMEDMCRFETAWLYQKISPWCLIFNEDEWRLLEYIDDLYYYYESGYGVELNKLLGCFALQDLLNHFRDIEGKDDVRPKGIFYSGSSRLFMNFLTTLDIAKDSKPLLANNYHYMEGRKWRTGAIAPFFANFVATFYRCDDLTSSNKVTFHLNGKLLMYEGCNNGICDWEYLKITLGSRADKCNDNCINRIELLHRHTDKIVLLIILLTAIAFVFRRLVVNKTRRVIKLLRVQLRNDSQYEEITFCNA